MKNGVDLKTKSRIGMAIIYFVLLAVFNMLVFFIFDEKNSVFWLSYVMCTLAFGVQIASMFMAFKTSDIETAFFGIPLASFSIFYLITQVVVGFLFMFFQQANFKLAFSVQIIILAIFIIIAVISILTRDAAQEISENVQVKVSSHKSIVVDVEILMDSCANPVLKESLRKLNETMKYSDPMSNEAVENVEQRIKAKLSELRYYVEDNQVDNAIQSCKDMERLYIERNKKLAISK